MNKKATSEDTFYLIFEGGGGKGVVNEGVLSALKFPQIGLLPEHTPVGLIQQYLNDLQGSSPDLTILETLGKPQNQVIGLAGASAGAITAFALCLGSSSKDPTISSVSDKVKKILEMRLWAGQEKMTYSNRVLLGELAETEEEKKESIGVFNSFFDFPLEICYPNFQSRDDLLDSEEWLHTFYQRRIRQTNREKNFYVSDYILHTSKTQTDKNKTYRTKDQLVQLDKYFGILYRELLSVMDNPLYKSDLIIALGKDPILKSMLFYFETDKWDYFAEVFSEKMADQIEGTAKALTPHMLKLFVNTQDISKHTNIPNSRIDNNKMFQRWVNSLMRMHGVFSGRGPVLFFRYIIQKYIFEDHREAIDLILENLDKIEELGISKAEYWKFEDEQKFIENFSFHHLKILSGLDLRVTVTNLTDGRSEIMGAFDLSYEHMPIPEVLSASMSLPGVFIPLVIEAYDKRKKKNIQKLYTDGGQLNNLPLHAFDTQQLNTVLHSMNISEAKKNNFGLPIFNTSETPFINKAQVDKKIFFNSNTGQILNVFNSAFHSLGFRLESGNELRANYLRMDIDYYPIAESDEVYELGDHPLGGIFNMAKLLLGAFLTRSEESQIRDVEEAYRVIEIFCGNLSVTEFNPPFKKKKQWIVIAQRKVFLYFSSGSIVSKLVGTLNNVPGDQENYEGE